LGSVEGISLLEEPEGYYSNRWLSTIVVDPELTSGVTREKIASELHKLNIESRPLWKPMHLQPVFSDSFFFGNGVSEELFKDGLCLPSGSNLTSSDMERTIEGILKVFK
jgi:dTDP-4-amino-4,6-dideoxygalactose transaminase